MASPNDMIDPITNNVLIVDSRILSKTAWEENPETTHKLLLGVLNGGQDKNVELLVEKFLDITKKPFSINYEQPIHSQDFILTLGHALNLDGTAKPELIERLHKTLEAFSDNPYATILTSGNGEQSGIKESIFMKNWLIQHGIPEQSILVEEQSRDTVENLQYSIPILKKYNAKNVLLITGSEHMYRSYTLFEAYVEKNNINIHLTQLASSHSTTQQQSIRNQRTEDFLLFKDLGRILNLWEYQEWKSPTPIFSNFKSLSVKQSQNKLHI